MFALLLAALVGAAEPARAPADGATPPPPAADALNLTHLPIAEVEVDKGEARQQAERIPVRGPWRLVGSTRGIRSYEAPLPIRPRSLFYETAAEGMELRRGTTLLRYANFPDDADEAGTWAYSADSITVRLRPNATRPEPGDLEVRYAAARKREDALHRPTSRGTNAEFVIRSAQVDDVSRRGVYLTAPSRVAWDVDVVAGAQFEGIVGILPPEVDDGVVSDGADLVLRVDGQIVLTHRARIGAWDRVEADLSPWSGKRVRVELASRDDATARDHLFVASPRIFVPKAAPKRLVLVFVDTLRRDHVGAYGYRRETTPNIDAWAEGGVVFDEARSVAPWTLPSARALLTGRQPELYGEAVTLQERLSRAGWATAAYVGNVYLSSNFDMAEHWDEHGCINWPSAEVETERALDWLARNDDRDAMVLVHYMDTHLPYKEPRRYQHLFAGEPPAGLPTYFSRFMLMNAANRNRDLVKRYLLDRYDQNVRYVDDQVARLLRAVGDDATVVFFSDHGEEFFDHGDLEHGHTLYDELIRVPLVVRAPGLAPRRTSVAASLLDLTPTLLDLVGLPSTGLEGRSLSKAARGEDDPALTDRPVAFGRPLYGNEAWGVVRGALKYITRSGVERIHDLKQDPAEANNLRPQGADPVPLRAALVEGLARPLALAYRLTPRGRATGVFEAEVHVPGGIEAAWVGDDPTRKSDASLERKDDETVKVTFRSFQGVHREAYVVPRRPPEEVAGEVTLRVPRAGVEPVSLTPLPYEGVTTVLGRVGASGRAVEVSWAVTPLPAGQAVSGFDPELLGALKSMGYLSDDRGGGVEGDDGDDGDDAGEDDDASFQGQGE